jgi:hypothetical protein
MVKRSGEFLLPSEKEEERRRLDLLKEKKTGTVRDGEEEIERSGMKMSMSNHCSAG